MYVGVKHLFLLPQVLQIPFANLEFVLSSIFLAWYIFIPQTKAKFFVIAMAVINYFYYKVCYYNLVIADAVIIFFYYKVCYYKFKHNEKTG